jgi:hypothetical protein
LNPTTRGISIDTGWLELAQRVLAPAQEREPLVVALELELHVPVKCVGPAEDVRDDRVVDHQLGGNQRVDLPGVAAQRPHRLAHGRQVHDGRHPGQVLHEHASGAELDLGGGLGRGVPAGQRGDVVSRDIPAVLRAQQVLEQHLQAVGQVRRAVDRVQPVYLIAGPGHVQGGAAAKAVSGHVSSSSCRPRPAALVESSRTRPAGAATPRAGAAGRAHGPGPAKVSRYQVI